MADEETVNRETGQHQEPQAREMSIAVAIGTDSKTGEFCVVSPSLDIFRQLANVLKAQEYLMERIKFDRKPEDKASLVTTGAVPPQVERHLRGMNGSGKVH